MVVIQKEFKGVGTLYLSKIMRRVSSLLLFSTNSPPILCKNRLKPQLDQVVAPPGNR